MIKPATKYLAELIGTFCLVLFGCGAASISGASIQNVAVSGIGILGIALAFGVSVAVMAYTIGPISGCHINPAISIAMMVAGKLTPKLCAGYIIAQCAGAILASAVLYTLLSGNPNHVFQEYALAANGWGSNYLAHYNATSAFLGELVFTFLFLIVIFGNTAPAANPSLAGLAIGLSLTLIHMVLIPVTGTSVNPARSLGPALFSGGKALQQLWLFIAAPILGGIIAAVFWKNVMEKGKGSY